MRFLACFVDRAVVDGVFTVSLVCSRGAGFETVSSQVALDCFVDRAVVDGAFTVSLVCSRGGRI
jgi:hypothetical protein